MINVVLSVRARPCHCPCQSLSVVKLSILVIVPGTNEPNHYSYSYKYIYHISRYVHHSCCVPDSESHTSQRRMSSSLSRSPRCSVLAGELATLAAIDALIINGSVSCQSVKSNIIYIYIQIIQIIIIII